MAAFAPAATSHNRWAVTKSQSFKNTATVSLGFPNTSDFPDERGIDIKWFPKRGSQVPVDLCNLT